MSNATPSRKVKRKAHMFSVLAVVTIGALIDWLCGVTRNARQAEFLGDMAHKRYRESRA